MKYLSLPTWVIVLAVIPLVPPEHPWYKEEMTLERWNRGQTALAQQFDGVIWGLLILTAILVTSLILHPG